MQEYNTQKNNGPFSQKIKLGFISQRLTRLRMLDIDLILHLSSIISIYLSMKTAKSQFLKLKNQNQQNYMLRRVNIRFINNFMWNIITSNRLLDKKRKQQAQRKHLAALKHMKPSIDNQQPQSFNFLYSRPKQRLLKQQRQYQIENSNNILVERMITIASVNKPKQTYVKDSLNLSFNKKIQRQIDLGNQALVRRLRSVSSQYAQRNLGKFVQQYHKAKNNLSRSRANTTVYELQMPSTSKNISNKKRPYSAKLRPYSAKV